MLIRMYKPIGYIWNKCFGIWILHCLRMRVSNKFSKSPSSVHLLVSLLCWYSLLLFMIFNIIEYNFNCNINLLLYCLISNIKSISQLRK